MTSTSGLAPSASVPPAPPATRAGWVAPAAAGPPRRRAVDLPEPLEDDADGLLPDPDARVAHDELPRVVARARHLGLDAPARRELDRVRQKVDHDLADANGVGVGHRELV